MIVVAEYRKQQDTGNPDFFSFSADAHVMGPLSDINPAKRKDHGLKRSCAKALYGSRAAGERSLNTTQIKEGQ